MLQFRKDILPYTRYRVALASRHLDLQITQSPPATARTVHELRQIATASSNAANPVKAGDHRRQQAVRIVPREGDIGRNQAAKTVHSAQAYRTRPTK
jgi:hypothetical protein